MSLFAAHLATWHERFMTAARRCNLDGVAVYAGQLKYRFGDDRNYDFVANPHYVVAAPQAIDPGCWVVFRESAKPLLIFLQPRDYWHVVPDDPSGDWVDCYEIRKVTTADEVAKTLPAGRTGLAFIGEEIALAQELGFTTINPAAAISYLEYQRAWKTEYEIELMAAANGTAARAHVAAEAAFRSGASEFQIQTAYIKAAGQMPSELPYSNIVGLNEHAAVLHYTSFDTAAPESSRSFLIDAGASCCGYASDITRTYSAQDDEFAEMITTMDARQRQLGAAALPGKDYRELHLDAHRQVGEILVAFDLIDGSAEAAVADGITSAFFPHGLGHLIGSQVHDAAGHAASDDGGEISPPEGHPHLRFTRTLESDMVVTIEPGLYFIDMLLEPLRAGGVGRRINWSRVDHFRPYGGIRIEDDVVVRPGVSRNLSREAFAALGVSS